MHQLSRKRLTGVLLAALIATASVFGVSIALSKSGGGIKRVDRSYKGATKLAKSIFEGKKRGWSVRSL